MLLPEEAGHSDDRRLILGFPRIHRRRSSAISRIRKNCPIDFSVLRLTPLPGSEDHQTLWMNALPWTRTSTDTNVEHVCSTIQG